MALECINPADLPTPSTYTHVVVATGSRWVFIAGQEPEDQEGSVVGHGDLAAQARQVFANLGRALAAAGARPEQVAKITIYVVAHRVSADHWAGSRRFIRRPQAGRHPRGRRDAGRARVPDRSRGDRGPRLTDPIQHSVRAGMEHGLEGRRRWSHPPVQRARRGGGGRAQAGEPERDTPPSFAQVMA